MRPTCNELAAMTPQQRAEYERQREIDRQHRLYMGARSATVWSRDWVPQTSSAYLAWMAEAILDLHDEIQEELTKRRQERMARAA